MIVPIERLRDEIAGGRLCLKADDMTRCRFRLEVDGVAVGCYALRSTAPFEVRAERAWNGASRKWDHERAMFVPQLLVRRFDRITKASKVTIVELMPQSDEVRDKVSFVSQAVALFDGPDKIDGRSKQVLKFECVDLQGVKIQDG